MYNLEQQVTAESWVVIYYILTVITLGNIGAPVCFQLDLMNTNNFFHSEKNYLQENYHV